MQIFIFYFQHKTDAATLSKNSFLAWAGSLVSLLPLLLLSSCSWGLVDTQQSTLSSGALRLLCLGWVPTVSVLGWGVYQTHAVAHM